MQRRLTRTLGAILLLSASLPALEGPARGVGPEWPETAGGDAGALPAIAQEPTGFGVLNKIHGELMGDAGLLGGSPGGHAGGDFQDVYLIRIADPSSFSATLDPASGGGGSFDTRLWLFNADERGVLGNDNISEVSALSEIGNLADDGSGFGVFCPGLYYLAISGAPSDPVGISSLPIFLLASATEVSGPDGPAGSMMVTGWTIDGEDGTYTIALTGVNFVTCDNDIDASGDVGFDDLLTILSNWGPCPGCPEDLVCDGTVGFDDLLAVLSTWGPCPP